MAHAALWGPAALGSAGRGGPTAAPRGRAVGRGRRDVTRAPGSVPRRGWERGRWPAGQRRRAPGLTSELELVLRLEAQDLLHLRHVPRRRAPLAGKPREVT